MKIAVGTRPRAASMPVAVVAALGAVIVALYATLLLPRHAWETWFIKEDRLIEMPGSLALLASSIVFLLALLHLRRMDTAPRLLTWACATLAAVFFFGFGEEISWGQRILGLGEHVGTGEFNEQDEINLHNLKLFSGWFTVDRMFQVFWVGFGVLVPIAAAASSRANAWLRKLVPVLPVAIALLLIANQVVADIAREVLDDRYASIYPLHYSVFEIKESMISILLAAGAYFWYRNLRRGGDQDLAAA